MGTFIDLIMIASNNMRDKNKNVLNQDMPNLIAWFVVCIYILIFFFGIFAGVFSVAEDVALDTETPIVVEKPVVEEPVVQESVVEEPVVEEPVVEESSTYISKTVKELYDELDSNALRAEQRYQNAYIKLTGYLSGIDSDGSYISLVGSKDTFDFQSVHCSITDDSQIDKIVNFDKGDSIIIYGKITSIGEVLGYSLDIIDIE